LGRARVSKRSAGPATKKKDAVRSRTNCMAEVPLSVRTAAHGDRTSFASDQSFQNQADATGESKQTAIKSSEETVYRGNSAFAPRGPWVWGFGGGGGLVSGE